MRAGVLALVAVSVAVAGWHVGAASTAERSVPPGAMSVKVVPFRDTTLVYLDGEIDASAADRLARVLDGVDGKIAVWLNSPGGNLYAGMQLGRSIRRHGASTHIIDSSTLLPGECYSACSLAFLGGVFRFASNGARYGVHRASMTAGPDLAEHLTAAVAGYMREMGVDARLLDFWTKAGPDEMYVLTWQETERLGVVDNGRKKPVWRFARSPGGSRLEGRQATIDGTGTVFFSCDDIRTVFGAVYEDVGAAELLAARGGSHWLTITGRDDVPLTATELSRTTFVLAPDLVRLARFATQIGHRMKPASGGEPSIGCRVDVDAKSASLVRSFLGNCLRRQAKRSS